MHPRRRVVRRPSSLRRRAAAALLPVLASSVLLAGCTPTVVMTAAPDANAADCAAVIVRLPDDVGNLTARQTDAQSTAAWGNPDQVLLHCGVTVPGPSSLPCVNPGGGDLQWLRDDSDASFLRFTTFGTDPAVEVVVANDADVSAGQVLQEVATAVSYLPSNGLACTTLDDTVTGEDLPAG